MAPHQRQLAGLILALTVFPVGARAQTVTSQSGPDWQRVDTLAPGTRIVVTLKTGEKRIGDFRRSTPNDVMIAVRLKERDVRSTDETTLPKSLIATVATSTDRLLNGALIGAGIGTGLAMWDYLIDPSEPGNAAIFTVAIGLGAAIGAGIDALVNRRGKLLYASARHTPAVTISPLLRKDQQGLLVFIRF